MTAIRLVCETCGVKLRVRDEGFIGQIHACPRCGGMVQILATASSTAAASASAADEPPEVSQLTLGLSETLSAEPDGLDESDADAGLDAEEATDSGSAAPAPLAAWAPVAVTATTLLATVGLVVSWALRDGDTPETANTPAIEVGGPSPPMTIDAAPESSGGSEDTVHTERSETTDFVAAPAPISEPPEGDAIAADANDALPAPPSMAAAPIEETAPGMPLAEADEPPADPELIAAEEATTIDPLAVDPDALELVLLKSPGGASSPRALPTEDSPAPAATEPANLAPTEQQSLDEQLTETGRRGAVWVRRLPGENREALPEPAAPRLAMAVPSIELREAPLDEAVTLLAEIAGAPIAISPRALLRAGARADRPIDLRGEGQSIATLLDAALEPGRLGFEVDGPHTRVVRRGASVSRTVPHRLGDLAGDDPEGFARMIARLGFELPADADLAAAKTPLELTMGEHCDLLVLCETLRVARSRTTVSKFPADALPIRSPWRSMADRLRRRTTFRFVEPTELRDVVAHWRRVLGTPVLVDWPSLADAGLHPASKLSAAVTNRPWSAALDGVLGPLGIDWAPIHGDAVWIASAERVAAEPSIALYRSDEAALATEIVSNSGDGASFARDPQSGAAIVVAPPGVHRQIVAALEET